MKEAWGDTCTNPQNIKIGFFKATILFQGGRFRENKWPEDCVH